MDGSSTLPAPTALSRLARAFVWVTIPTLLFIQLFVTFRGLSSPLGMEEAQLARELARGNGRHTLVVRPFAWRQLLDHGKDPSPLEMRDTITPPLPPLLLAPALRAFESLWEFDTRVNVYLLDRVVAAVGLVFFIGSAGMAWCIARRLFDGAIAGWTFVTVLASQFLWDVGRSGQPQMAVLFFFSIALHQLLLALEAAEAGRGSPVRVLAIGLTGALAVLAHWMAIWLLFGFAAAAAWRLRPKALSAVLVLAPALAALGAWGMANQVAVGDAFGATKGILQAALVYSSDSWLLRDFTGHSPPAAAEFVVKKVMINVTAQVQDLYTHCGGVLPAVLFFLALFHPFRKPEVRAFARSLAVVWLFATAGMALTGLPLKEKDDNQLHSLFVPVMSAYGFAFLAVLWGRLGVSHARSGWWSRHGLAAAAFAVSALPMITNLPTELTLGLGNKGEFAHWPPYMPRQIHKVAAFTRGDELIFTDMPWAVSWYADRPCVWLPMDRKQFDDMRALAGKHAVDVAGILMTPESLRVERPAAVFNGEYREWSRLAFRGLGAGFGTDLMAQTDFPYREFIPLAGQPGSEPGRFVAEIAFMSDRKRWEPAPDAPMERKQAEASPATRPAAP